VLSNFDRLCILCILHNAQVGQTTLKSFVKQFALEKFLRKLHFSSLFGNFCEKKIKWCAPEIQEWVNVSKIV
jgi:hypothetical protein